MNKATAIKKNKVTPKSKTLTSYPKFQANGNESSNLDEVMKDEIENNEGEGLGINVRLSAGSPRVSLHFSEQENQFCCGIRDLGELSISSNFPIPTATKILDSFIKNSHKGYTFTMSTNGIGQNKTFELALAKCEYWTKIKTFKNANSGNMVTLWVSNNE